MSLNALVVGEALIDEVVEGDRIIRHPGGSPANVALGLALLGVETRLHTAIGNDADGRLIYRHLSGRGVTLTSRSVTSAPTSKAMAILAPDGSARYHFALSWDPAPLADLGSPTLIHTGSLCAFLQPGSEVTKDILRRGRAKGALSSFDPNIRQSVISETERTRALFAEWLSSSQLVKMSDEDADYLYPGIAPEDVLDVLLASGVSVAAITRGGDGASLASGRHRVHIRSVKTRVSDTVGAGDSFMAALIWALVFTGEGWDGLSIPDTRLTSIGEAAARAAEITVSRTGADLPDTGDLQGAGIRL